MINQNLIGLRKAINESFNSEELRSLCMDIGVDFENLGGRGKVANIDELLVYCVHHNLAHSLNIHLNSLRPQVSWDSYFPYLIHDRDYGKKTYSMLETKHPENGSNFSKHDDEKNWSETKKPLATTLLLGIVTFIVSLAWFIGNPSLEPFIALLAYLSLSYFFYIEVKDTPFKKFYGLILLILMVIILLGAIAYISGFGLFQSVSF